MGWNVFVTRRIPEVGLEILRRECERVDVNPEDRVMTRAEMLAAVPGRDGILCLLTDRIDDEIMAAADRARGFANYAVGYDNIDVEAARRRGLVVTNTPGVLTDATADLAWALLFAAARRVVAADRHMRSGEWNGWGPMQFLGADIAGATLGVVGAGRIGESFARRSAGFAMPLLYTDPRPNAGLERDLGARRVPLEELLRESDFVSLHPPFLPETAGLIGERELGLMKPTAILVNTSRGGVVDEEALVQALRAGRPAAAGLDVYADEPRTAPGLTELDNLVCTPHIASATHRTRNRMAEMAARDLLAILRGEKPANPVCP
jgi:lactate dehydrogenase-like 2-hydroxyacid dehydrogenase